MDRAHADENTLADALDHECAITICDVLERRVRANLFGADNGLGQVEEVAAAVGRRVGWSEDRRQAEIDAYRARVAEDVAWRKEAS